MTMDRVRAFVIILFTKNKPVISSNYLVQSRVGFANHKKPQLIFRNLVAKPRKDRKKDAKEELQNVQQPVLIGNDIVNIETMRFQLRTQFDRNVVTHYYLQVKAKHWTLTVNAIAYFMSNILFISGTNL